MTRCPLCSCDNAEILIRDGRDYEYGVSFQADVARCGACGLVFQVPPPGWEDLPGYYPPEYANYSVPTSLVARLLLKGTDYLEARQVIKLLGRTGRILDVGCGSGYYFDVLSAYGDWTLEGTEISPESAAVAIAKGYPVFIGQLEDLDLPAEQYDLVRMNHLLEHVINPVTTLEKVHRLLRPGGYLLLETPNVSCPDFHLFRRYWGALHLPRHIHLFNPRNLRRLLDSSGFDLGRLQFTLMTTGWALSIQNWLKSWRDIKLVNGRMKSYPLLLLGFLPFLVVQKALGVSTMMRVWARKR